jgi:tetratricopeptide (TPR) repeat protein
MAQASGRSVKPPDVVDKNATAQPGLVLSTNSRSWQKLVSSHAGKGAVVLFIQPGGPSDGKAIARGDLLTAVDGTPVINHEAAIALLRSRPGQKRDLKFVQRDGSERTVTIQARNPKGAQLRAFLNPMVSANDNDAVLHFLRAQAAGGTYDSNLADVNRSLELEPQFVEAMTLKASLQWDHRIVDSKNALGLVNEALAGWKSALDIDPDNSTALSVRSTAYTSLGRGAKGKEDANKTLSLDNTYPRGYFALALADMQQGDPQGALGPSAAAVKLNPYNFQYFELLATTFRRAGRKADCTATGNAMKPFLIANNLNPSADTLLRICA